MYAYEIGFSRSRAMSSNYCGAWGGRGFFLITLLNILAMLTLFQYKRFACFTLLPCNLSLPLGGMYD